MEAVKAVVTYLLIFVFIIGVIITFGTLKANGFNIYILGTGITLVIIPLVILLVMNRAANQKEEDEIQSTIDDLKEYGIRIHVDLTQCEVITTNWYTENEIFSDNRAIFLNHLSGNDEKNIERKEHVLSVITCETVVKGELRKFESAPVNKDRATMRILLEMQRGTSVYVDRDDSSHYYFDISFLD